MKTHPLELDRVCFGYSRQVDNLHGVSFHVASGTTTALLGPNGSGKTTLLKLCMNLLRPQVGTIQLWGQRSTRMDIHARRRIGYVSENQEIPLHMTVEELCGLGRALYPSWDAA